MYCIYARYVSRPKSSIEPSRTSDTSVADSQGDHEPQLKNHCDNVVHVWRRASFKKFFLVENHYVFY